MGNIVITRPHSTSRGIAFIETQPGTADSKDFVGYSGPVFFDAGEEFVSFPIGVKYDQNYEPNEYFDIKIKATT